eukprot:g15546.t1
MRPTGDDQTTRTPKYQGSRQTNSHLATATALRMLAAFYQDLINVWDVVDLCQVYLPSEVAAIVIEPLLGNLHLHNFGFKRLAEGRAMLGDRGLGWMLPQEL